MDPNVMLEVPESANSVPVNRVFLRYSARGVAPQNVWYQVTSFPRFSDANVTLDAGRFINLKDLVRQGHTGDTQIKSVIKDLKRAQIGTVSKFSQQQINSGDIAYVPPLNDVGISDRVVFLNFTVVTNVGHRLMNQQMRIRVKAEDDKAPKLRTKVIAIQRGSQFTLRDDEIRISDVDTPLKKVIVEVTRLPAHGDLIDERGRVMITGYRFPATAITAGKIKYSNNGINFKSDKFNITVSDGPRTTNVTSVLINITDYDWNIGAWKDYVNYSIRVLENSSVVIREAVFPERNDTSNDVVYFVYENPVKGVIMRLNGMVSQFTPEDVRLNMIRYKHTTGEIGASTVYDFAKVSKYVDGSPQGLRKLNFSIIPVNSQAPSIKVMSDLIVIEGRRDLQSIIGYNVLAAIDKDTRESDVRIRVINKPLWGKIVVNEKEAYDFTMAQIREGVVKYIQSESGNGIEETRDQFSVTANDGKFNSKNEFVNVTIIPVNDEPPQLFLKDFNVDRGGTQRLDRTIFSVKDADIPQDDLQVRISRLPKAGNLVVYWKNGDKQPVTRWRNVFSRHYLTLTDLVYEHRRSDKAFEDSFQISVSDGKHQVSKTCRIRIMGENRLPPTLPSSHTLLIKSDVIGTLTKAQLDAKDADTPPPLLLYTLRRPPMFGQLVIGQEKKVSASRGTKSSLSATFDAKLPIHKGKTFTQADINSGKVAYIYLGKTKERVEDSLELDLTDGKVTIGPRRIVVVVSNPPQNKPLTMKAGVIKVIRGSGTALAPQDIKIVNNVTPVDRLKLEVARMSQCGLLLDTKADTKTSLTSFMYNELYDDRIVFSVEDCPEGIKDLAITLTVTDMSSRAEASLRVLIVSKRPVITRFLPLKVPQMNRKKIGPNLLNTQDPDTPPARIIYTLVATPAFGVLSLSGREVRPGETFSQADINRGNVHYVSIKKAPAGKDTIRLRVSDGDDTTYGFAGNSAKEGPIDFPVIILPVTQKLVLVVNRAPKTLINFGNMGYGFQFNEENLKSNFPKMTQFVVKRHPFIGELGLRRRSQAPEMTFTSADLAEGSLYYTTKSDNSKVMTNDSFEFILTVNKAMKGANQFMNNTKLHRMDLVWPKIQFSRKRYKICERAGTLNLRVVRSGLLYSKVSLQLSSEPGRGTRVPRDYLPSPKTVLEFDVGEKEKVYKVTIMDALKKKGKFNKKRRRFYVSIVSANNALIGEVSRAMVVIREGKKCRKDPDFLSPEEEKKERLAEAQREKARRQRLQAEDERMMLQDLKIPSDAELRRQSLLDRQLPVFELPSSEELRKFEQQKMNLAALSAVTNFPPCELTMNGKTRDHKMRTYVCDGVREEWLPLEDVFKDLPGCKPGWILHGKRCFRFYNTPMTWSGAKVTCVMRGARLAAPLTLERQKWITQTVSKKQRFWIGLHYDPLRDMWLYTDNSGPMFARWHRRRPSRRKLRRRNSRRCVMVNSFFSWVPRRCSSAKHSYGFVCEKEAT